VKRWYYDVLIIGLIMGLGTYLTGSRTQGVIIAIALWLVLFIEEKKRKIKKEKIE